MSTAIFFNAISTGFAQNLGNADNQGALTESLYEAVQKKLNLSDEQWANMVKQMTGQPDELDVANAKTCERDV